MTIFIQLRRYPFIAIGRLIIKPTKHEYFSERHNLHHIVRFLGISIIWRTPEAPAGEGQPQIERLHFRAEQLWTWGGGEEPSMLQPIAIVRTRDLEALETRASLERQGATND